MKGVLKVSVISKFLDPKVWDTILRFVEACLSIKSLMDSENTVLLISILDNLFFNSLSKK